MENEENIVQAENAEEENNLEDTEELTENSEEQSSSVNENGSDTSEFSYTDNNNNGSSVYTSEIIINDTQYNEIIGNLNLLNNLAVIQVMFIFTLFLYLFLHFTLERRKY